MGKIIYDIKSLKDTGIAEKLYNLWMNGERLDDEGRYLRFLYEGDEYYVSSDLYNGFMRLLYLELSNMVAKLSKLNPRLNEIANGKMSEEFQKFIDRFHLYLELSWKDEKRREIRKYSS